MSTCICLFACASGVYNNSPESAAIQRQVSQRINHHRVRDDSVRGMFHIGGHGVSMLQRSNDPEAVAFRLARTGSSYACCRASEKYSAE